MPIGPSPQKFCILSSLPLPQTFPIVMLCGRFIVAVTSRRSRLAQQASNSDAAKLPVQFLPDGEKNVRSTANLPVHIRIALVCFALLPMLSVPANRVSAQSAVASRSQSTVTSFVCPKCGRIHTADSARMTPPTATPTATSTVSVKPASSVTASSATASAPVAQVSYSPSSSGSGIQNVLGMLNGQRSRQGLRSLRYDPALQAVAERRARQMASMGIKSHPPGSFAPGRYEGVGWSSSYSPSGVHACYTSNPNMTAAGAAMVTGRDGVYFAVVYR